MTAPIEKDYLCFELALIREGVIRDLTGDTILRADMCLRFATYFADMATTAAAAARAEERQR